MGQNTAYSTEELDSLQALARDLKLARLRRRLTQNDMAARMDVSTPTYRALEAGQGGVALGTLLRAMTVLGYTHRIGQLLADDPIGNELDLATGRKRSRGSHGLADF